VETIMVVDDEILVRRLVTLVLENQGYVVLGARCGEHGVECFEKHPDEIELVLTDVVMPNMSGPEMVNRIRRQKASVKVLFMTGYGAPSGLPNPRQHRFGVILKPFTMETLTRAVRQCLDENGG
jgi:two-component system, cell cycle sensor histidine kinase and response regulator CckA